MSVVLWIVYRPWVCIQGMFLSPSRSKKLSETEWKEEVQREQNYGWDTVEIHVTNVILVTETKDEILNPPIVHLRMRHFMAEKVLRH